MRDLLIFLFATAAAVIVTTPVAMLPSHIEFVLFFVLGGTAGESVGREIVALIQDYRRITPPGRKPDDDSGEE